MVPDLQPACLRKRRFFVAGVLCSAAECFSYNPLVVDMGANFCGKFSFWCELKEKPPAALIFATMRVYLASDFREQQCPQGMAGRRPKQHQK
jgi:hypothetical protein